MLIKDSQLASGAIALLMVSSALLALALLGQAFTAGMAAIVDPEWWQTHLAWVHVFQWLVVIIPVSAAASSARRHVKWASLGSLVLMGLEYVLAHRGMEGSFPVGLGLHAVGAFILFGMAVYLLFKAGRAFGSHTDNGLVGSGLKNPRRPVEKRHADHTKPPRAGALGLRV